MEGTKRGLQDRYREVVQKLGEADASQYHKGRRISVRDHSK